MENVRVENMESSRGNTVPNQFIIWTDKGSYFQSYSTVIAYRDFNGNLTLDADKWDYSRTTGKYRNQFTRMNKRETEQAIADGRIKLANLNQ